MMTTTLAWDPHPHEPRGLVPDRLPAETIRELSVLRPHKAILAILIEWLGIAGAIVLCEAIWSPFLYVLVVVWIGARQHALTVLGHDASHFRLLPGRHWNDWVGNVMAFWPTFVAVENYRQFHGEHHRFTGTPADGNRRIWRTHTSAGELTAEWTFPKTRAALTVTLLRRAVFFTGIFWIVRGLAAAVVLRRSWGQVLVRLLFYAAIIGVLATAGALKGFLLYWIVPFCTAHIAFQYIRLICEHSAVKSKDPAYALTRTTRARWWERLMIVPRNIHYHIEHHWYPSVPFYNLHALHNHLMAHPQFRQYAVVTPSVAASLRQCVVS
jgi:fatty acid desaturase